VAEGHRHPLVLIYLYFQVNKDLKCTYVFSNCTYYGHNISNFLCKNYFEHHIDSSVSKQFITYFITQKLLKFRIQLTTNPIEVMMVLYFYLQGLFIYFFMHMSKIASIINFSQTIFSIYFTMLLPLDLILVLNYMKVRFKYPILVHAKYLKIYNPRY